MLTVLAVIGARMVFALPLELQANWIFRAVGLPRGAKIFVATRRIFLLLCVVSVWLISAVVCFGLWPWHQAAADLIVLGLLGTILVDLTLYGFRKIPFACSYLPGKSQVHMVFITAIRLVLLVAQGVTFERQALREPHTMLATLLALGVVAVALTWRTTVLALSDEEGLQFEAVDPSALLELGLSRDGGMPAVPPPDQPIS